MDEIIELEGQIAALKERRDRLIRESGVNQRQLQRILAARTPKRTLCQLLRELHDVLDGGERHKVAQCLLIAKKMDSKLRDHYGGDAYVKDWYDEDGEFIGD